MSYLQNRGLFFLEGMRNREKERKREEMQKRKKDKGEREGKKEREKKLVPLPQLATVDRNYLCAKLVGT